ncbi:MAG: hypothetical protein F4092_08175 [Rhodospirillaceae bacterium]|nr:hypothetical protein [Rhodospirillaceae bacterium]MYJ71729.1 hypothetical protein [Rhodospirillaceae bacterium]
MSKIPVPTDRRPQPELTAGDRAVMAVFARVYLRLAANEDNPDERDALRHAAGRTLERANGQP